MLKGTVDFFFFIRAKVCPLCSTNTFKMCWLVLSMCVEFVVTSVVFQTPTPACGENPFIKATLHCHVTFDHPC